MRISRSVFLMIVVTPLFVMSQDAAPVVAPGPPPQVRVTTGGAIGGDMGGMMAGKQITIHREMGKWWENSRIVKELQLKDAQISQLNQIFFDHRLKLIDYGAEMEKADLKLQNLLDADVPSETQVGAQVDQVLAARGKLEREYTMMNLDLRKVLSVDQWKQLKTIRDERGPSGNVFYFKKGPMMPDGPMELRPEQVPLPPLPPPGPGGDEMF
jgi:Spy/CpxP family protein refolding chaperone